MSEFNIFNCSTKKSYVEYEAVQTCRITAGKDSLIIHELKYLPVGENWAWKWVQISEQTITSGENDLFVSDVNPKIAPFSVDKELQNSFLDSMKLRKNGTVKFSYGEMEKLEVLALSGNEEAWKILKNYEEFTGTTPDGALAETLNESISTVEFVNKISDPQQ